MSWAATIGRILSKIPTWFWIVTSIGAIVPPILDSVAKMMATMNISQQQITSTTGLTQAMMQMVITMMPMMLMIMMMNLMMSMPLMLTAGR